jgi:hypothetical protein
MFVLVVSRRRHQDALLMISSLIAAAHVPSMRSGTLLRSGCELKYFLCPIKTDRVGLNNTDPVTSLSRQGLCVFYQVED